METIPLIRVKNRNIQNFQIKDILSPGRYIEQDSSLYVLDYDGIEKNKPNICTYQKLSKYYDIWADFAPKNIGDVVDSFMSGVRSIIIRAEYYPKFNPIKIKEISDNYIYQKVNYENKEIKFPILTDKIDGYISFSSREDIESDFKYKSMIDPIKDLLYIYEENYDDIDYWEKLGIKGILIDIDKIKKD